MIEEDKFKKLASNSRDWYIYQLLSERSKEVVTQEMGGGKECEHEWVKTYLDQFGQTTLSEEEGINKTCIKCGKTINEPREDDLDLLEEHANILNIIEEYDNGHEGVFDPKEFSVVKQEDLMKMIGELRYKIYGYDKEEWFTPLEKQIGYDFKEDLRKILQERKDIKNLGGANN